MSVIVSALTKLYGAQKAVDNISFAAQPGEVLGFLGPNGAGKTTTMKIISCYIPATAGSVEVCGFDTARQSMDVRRNIGYLPEHNPLYKDLYVKEYLGFFARLHGLSKPLARIAELIELTGLGREQHKQIGTLSKGYRQRVGLAQALIHDPAILILDEPTTGLDPNQIVEIRQLIRDIGKEKTVILSTHILPEVEATCDRILIINRGRIAADGTADMLRRQSQGNNILHARIEGAVVAQVKTALEALPGVTTVSVLDAEGGRFELQSAADVALARAVFALCVQRQWVATELIPYETRLEDVFRNLTLN